MTAVIHDFDISMANVSIGMDQDLMVDILISKVRVKITRSGFETYKDKRYHGIRAYLLEIKWGIGLESFIKSSSVNLHRKRKTGGWRLLLEWKDSSVDWFPLNDLKHYNPVDLAKYAVANEISDEPAFNY